MPNGTQRPGLPTNIGFPMAGGATPGGNLPLPAPNQGSELGLEQGDIRQKVEELVEMLIDSDEGFIQQSQGLQGQELMELRERIKQELVEAIMAQMNQMGQQGMGQQPIPQPGVGQPGVGQPGIPQPGMNTRGFNPNV